ncbi:hypothetical protein O3W44_02520 [Pantoea sp. LMR881]|uniref:hypothetical protein n=1 Tax=Pantoea sp. LMR881 TaxID=3014336 RepID=UPI0022B0796D|nr:hypothetical protein [Pantoea sp. LMR881]MCZ4058209.1 hypothetical protein [Pantoea sp. LMR881]
MSDKKGEPSKEHLEYLVKVAAGVIEDLKSPIAVNNLDNVRKILNRGGISEILEAASWLDSYKPDRLI